jgi:fido (protein-threonine AMPylation protein)
MGAWEPIPGETPIDPSQLVPSLRRTVHHRSELNILEARSIRPAVVKYLAGRPTRRQAPFSLDWIYKLHREMFGKVWVFAGKRRNRMLNIGVEVYQIDPQLRQLLDDLAYWEEHETHGMIEQAARLHHRAVQIHPFENGNGR